MLIALVLVVAWRHRDELRQIEPWIEQHSVVGALVYVLAGAASVVLLPLSSLPLVPLAARLWGVWVAGALSAAGWWLGALLAFWIARLARPSLERFVSLSALDRLERSLPPDVGFAAIVVLRIILPVDVTSFALGLLRELRFITYATASLVGIIPFAFVWSYAGSRLGRGDYLEFAALATVLVVVGVAGKRYWFRGRGPKPPE